MSREPRTGVVIAIVHPNGNTTEIPVESFSFCENGLSITYLVRRPGEDDDSYGFFKKEEVKSVEILRAVVYS